MSTPRDDLDNVVQLPQRPATDRELLEHLAAEITKLGDNILLLVQIMRQKETR